MTHLVEDFSVEVPVTNPNITDQYTENVDLKIESWSPSIYIAFTFNSKSENTAKQLYKALEKYKKLRFITGVIEHAENRQIQRTIRSHMSRLYGDKVSQEAVGGFYEDTIFELQK